MIKQLMILSGVTVLLSVCQNVYAVDALLHPKITAHAIAEYNNKCANPLTAAGAAKLIDTDSGNILVAFTEREDDVTLSRITNWHFYDDTRGTKAEMKKSQSLHRIYGERIREFIKAARENNNNGLYEAGGRILHYLQDMAVPAHVAPNYHAKAKGWERLFMENKPDPFDGYLDPWQVDYILSARHCGELLAMNDKLIRSGGSAGNGPDVFLEKLLTQLADDTRHEMSKTIPAVSGAMRGRTWESVFWTKRDPDKEGAYPKNIKYGFAPYGGDDRKRFNLTSGICVAEGNNNACRGFVRNRYQAAVDASVRMIMYLALQQENHKLSASGKGYGSL